MSSDWSDILAEDLRKMMREQYKDWNIVYGSAPDTLVVPPALEKTAREVLGLSSSDPKPAPKSTLESIIDEQCKKLKEVSYD